jgi:hypothetical protein
MIDDLRVACARQPNADTERIAEGRLVAYSGKAAPAEPGTLALARGDVRFVFTEEDIRRVEKVGEHYQVWVAAEANVLVRLETVIKAADGDCGLELAREAPEGSVTLFPVEVCEPQTLCFPIAGNRQFCFTIQVCKNVLIPILV